MNLEWIKFHVEWLEMINDITDNGERLQWYDAIAGFVLNGEQPPSVQMRLITNTINKEIAKAEEISTMRSNAGKKGMEVRWREKHSQQDAEMVDVETLSKELIEELSKGGELLQSAVKSYGLTKEDLIQCVSLFKEKLKLDGVSAKSPSDFQKHYFSWLKNNAKRIFNNNGNINDNNKTEYINALLDRIHARGNKSNM